MAPIRLLQQRILSECESAGHRFMEVLEMEEAEEAEKEQKKKSERCQMST
jgi:hypothetical protein